MLPSLSGLVPTGAGESIPPEVALNPDLMVEILTALSAGNSEEACEMAMRWCASHRDACDERLWHELRCRIFPQTSTANMPLYAHSEKRWFYMLCHGLEAALAKEAAARLNLQLSKKQPFMWPTYTAFSRNPDGSEITVTAFRGVERNLQFEYDLANLQLQVILSGRYRRSLAYTKWNMWKPRAGVPPHVPPPHAGPHAAVLTWEEMEAQLDRLEGRTDESDDAGVDGDDNM